MSKQRLLVIDDDLHFRQFMQNFAEAMEIDAVVTGTPERFKQAYLDFQPTVILTDLFMPECDGFELLEWLFEKGCTARIVLISGHDEHYLNTARKLCRDRGVPEIATVSKPSTLQQLTAAMGVSAEGIKPFAI